MPPDLPTWAWCLLSVAIALYVVMVTTPVDTSEALSHLQSLAAIAPQLEAFKPVADAKAVYDAKRAVNDAAQRALSDAQIAAGKAQVECEAARKAVDEAVYKYLQPGSTLATATPNTPVGGAIPPPMGQMPASSGASTLKTPEFLK